MSEHPTSERCSVESLLGQAADEFSRQLDKGEQPDVEEYAERYPEIADAIREVFPALQVMPSVESDGTGALDLPPGEPPAVGTLGDYRLIREIGRGGMGIVYEAEQISLGRRVALKVLSFAAVLDQKQLQRFKNEAQAAAHLHHTNIVPVISVGCERGVHYYAMQYIEGHPLSAVIRELRRLGGLEASETPLSQQSSILEAAATSCPARCATPTTIGSGSSAASGFPPQQAKSSLVETITATGSIRSRAFFQSLARLGIQAAEALQHAHERGVIHRDVKPSNLLLDGDGSLWITDFGLAMMPTDPGLTVTGDLLGTIRYMSPEQALAKRVPLDHRTDIYSLGVTLYELLALEPAYTGHDREELLRQIALEEPRPLRKVNSAVPRELEIIVGKAMAKSAGDRYSAAQELADDLRRFLEDKPIWAKPPTLADRTAKWSRRHRSLVATSLVLLVLSVVGLSVGTLLIARERREALRQRDAAQEQRQLAEANLQRAREAVDRMLTRVAAAHPANAPNGARIRLALREEALDAAKALAAKTQEPGALRDLGVASVQLGDTRGELGQAERAEQAYRDALAVFEKLHNKFPETSEYRFDAANTCVRLGTRLWEGRRYGEAETMARQACSLMRPQATGESPQPEASRQQLAAALDLLGLVLQDTSRAQEAEASWREAIQLGEKLVADSPNSLKQPQCRLALASTQRNLAGLMLKIGRIDEAERAVRQTISSLERLASSFPDDPVWARELTLTRRWWDEALRLRETQSPPAEYADRRSETALSAFAPAELDGIDRSRGSEYHDILAKAYRAFDDALILTGQAEATEVAYRRALAVLEPLASSYPSTPKYREDLADLHRAQAMTMKITWRLQEAETAARKAVEIEEGLAADFPDRSDYRDEVESSRAALNDIRERMPTGQLISLSRSSADGVAAAIEVARTMDEAAMSSNAMLLEMCADLFALSGSYRRAEVAFRKAIELDPTSASNYRTLGWVLLGLGRREEAISAFREGLAVAGVQTPEQLAGACLDPTTLGYFLDLMGQDEFAARWRGVVVRGGRMDPWPWFFIGLRAELENRPFEAENAYRQAVEMGRTPHAHHTANWAAYRLEVLTGIRPLPPSTQTSENLPSDRNSVISIPTNK